MPDLPGAYIGHVLPGRLRIKIPSRKGDRAYSHSLSEAFSRLPGVEVVQVNPATASILFSHTIKISDIAGYAEANGFFSLKQGKPYPSNARQRIVRNFRSLDRQVEKFTDGEMDIAALSFVALTVAGIYQISVGNFMAIPWYTALWYGTNLFLKSSSKKSNEETHGEKMQ